MRIDTVVKAIKEAVGSWPGCEWAPTITINNHIVSIGTPTADAEENFGQIRASAPPSVSDDAIRAVAHRMVAHVLQAQVEADEADRYGLRAVEFLEEGDAQGAMVMVEASLGLERQYDRTVAVWGRPYVLLRRLIDPPSFSTTVRNGLVKLRNERGYTQADLAGRLDTTPETINRREKGAVKTDLEAVDDTLEKMGASLDDLLHEVGEGVLPRDRVVEELCAKTGVRHREALAFVVRQIRASGFTVATTYPSKQLPKEERRSTVLWNQRLVRIYLDPHWTGDSDILWDLIHEWGHILIGFPLQGHGSPEREAWAWGTGWGAFVEAMPDLSSLAPFYYHRSLECLSTQQSSDTKFPAVK